MATKPVSRKPAQEAQAKAEAATNPSIALDSRYMYTVKALGRDVTQVDVLGISKADMWMGNYATETV